MDGTTIIRPQVTDDIVVCGVAVIAKMPLHTREWARALCVSLLRYKDARQQLLREQVWRTEHDCFLNDLYKRPIIYRPHSAAVDPLHSQIGDDVLVLDDSADENSADLGPPDDNPIPKPVDEQSHKDSGRQTLNPPVQTMNYHHLPPRCPKVGTVSVNARTNYDGGCREIEFYSAWIKKDGRRDGSRRTTTEMVLSITNLSLMTKTKLTLRCVGICTAQTIGHVSAAGYSWNSAREYLI